MPGNVNYKGYKQTDFQELFINLNLLAVQTELYLSVKQSQKRNVVFFCGEPFLLGKTMESNLLLTLHLQCYVWSLYKVSKVQEIMRLTEKCITDVLYNVNVMYRQLQ